MLARHSVYIVLSALMVLGVPEFSNAVAAAGDARMVDGRHGGTQFWMHGGVESWTGDITYRIGFPVIEASGEQYAGYFPFSELEFPLDAIFGTIKAGAVLGDKLVVNAQVKKNITEPDDEMVDRDWTSSSYPWRLDIYS
ncbi:MAG TPA: hypothetical protein ENO11_03140, partial [Desulfobacteraceae bacterium]|nr:hypothetical protein [Desulfobacteraceae bacterium]